MSFNLDHNVQGVYKVGLQTHPALFDTYSLLYLLMPSEFNYSYDL